MEYFTLSHCWGKSTSLKLTKSRVDLWSSNIPFDDLPQTYQDAIVATNRLGFDYLWIDALCIVQDSKEDWNHEASTMSDVYRYSQCSLSALDAKDSSEGMFMSQHLKENIPLFLRSLIEEEPECLIYVEPDGYWDQQVTQRALHRRAWVMQEHVLAPRILHFNKDELLWECREFRASFTFPDGIDQGSSWAWPNLPAEIRSLPPRMRRAPREGHSALPLRMRRATREGDSALRKIWRDIVPLYTASDLTIASDKLIAIPGVARYLHTVIEDEYYAGLWRSDLMTQLLWRVSKRDGVRPDCYRAPSWSWASLDGQIVFGMPLNTHPVAFVNRIEITPVTDDVFGAI